MPFNSYHFTTHWRVQAPRILLFDILAQPHELPRWWPSVYLSVTELSPGDSQGVGRVIDLFTKGWLPYTLRWRFQVVAVERPSRIVLTATGDFVGRGVWTLLEQGDATLITYDWHVEAHKPLLRRLSFMLKPIFSANHRWAMRQGEISLRLEAARCLAATPEQRAQIPPPPPPTFLSLVKT